MARFDHCPMCGSVETPVFVHGHEQCRDCHTVLVTCCEGAPQAECGRST